MSSAYFAPLVTRPTVIRQPGKYITRKGEVVTITAVSGRHDFGCVGSYPNGVSEGWHRCGRIFATSLTENDIIRELQTAPSL